VGPHGEIRRHNQVCHQPYEGCVAALSIDVDAPVPPFQELPVRANSPYQDQFCERRLLYQFGFTSRVARFSTRCCLCIGQTSADDTMIVMDNFPIPLATIVSANDARGRGALRDRPHPPMTSPTERHTFRPLRVARTAVNDLALAAQPAVTAVVQTPPPTGLSAHNCRVVTLGGAR
jgi:hypothetical protein